MSREAGVETFGSEGAELMMWLVMRGAMDREVMVRHKHYFVPASMTGAGMIVLENKSSPRTSWRLDRADGWPPQPDARRSRRRESPGRTSTTRGAERCPVKPIAAAPTAGGGATPVGGLGPLDETSIARTQTAGTMTRSEWRKPCRDEAIGCGRSCGRARRSGRTSAGDSEDRADPADARALRVDRPPDRGGGEALHAGEGRHGGGQEDPAHREG